MKPRTKLAEVQRPDGNVLSLIEHDGSYNISFNGRELMHSRASASEVLLGHLGIENIRSADTDVRILVGGLGLGFTLQSVLDYVPSDAEVVVVELIPEIVDWNRQFLRSLHGNALEDSRVQIVVDDVGKVIAAAPEESYDVILLDVDNGPVAMVEAGNKGLYSNSGLRAIRRALKKGGRSVFWSASRDIEFETRLKRSSFIIDHVPAKTHEGAKRDAYMLYVADRAR